MASELAQQIERSDLVVVGLVRVDLQLEQVAKETLLGHVNEQMNGVAMA